MTLLKRLLTGIFSIFTLLFITLTSSGLFLLKEAVYEQHRDSIQRNLDIVNLTLAPHIEKKDDVSLSQAIQAILNAKEFKHIKVTLLHDNHVIERSVSDINHQFPTWLKDFNLFPELHEFQIVSSGWQELAHVELTTDSRFIYHDYFNKGLFFTSIVGCFILITLLLVVMHSARILRKLDKITQHAELINNNKFQPQKYTFDTHELNTINAALNTLCHQVKRLFEVQATEANKIREIAFKDPISGLSNRTYFLNQLESWLSESAIGGIIFIKHHQINYFFNNNENDKAELLILDFASELNALLSDTALTIARINNDEFAVLIANMTMDELKQTGKYLLTNFRTDNELASGSSPIALGIAANTNQNREVSYMLAQADSALQQACCHPNALIVLGDQETKMSLGKQQWKQLILDAIDNNLYVFKFQPAIIKNKSVLHHEVFSSIKKDGEYYSAAHFLSAIEQLELGEMFDKHVIQCMLSRLKAEPALGPLSINLTQNSIIKPAFIRWLSHQLQENQILAGRLFFEIPEKAFIRHADHLSLLTEHIVRNGFSFGVDNFGRHFKSLEYLSQFNPAFVKIDHAYTSSINDEAQSHVLASICRTAHNLNIIIIATRVETDNQLSKLSDLFINGFQGYIFEKEIEH